MEQLCPLHSEIKMKKGNQPESSRGAAGSVTRQRGRGLTPQPWSPLLRPPNPGPRTQSWAPRASRLCEPSALGSAVGTPRGRREQRSLWGRFFFSCDPADGKLIINTLQGQAGKPQTLKWWPGALQEWRAGPPGRSGKLCALCWRRLI